MYITYKSRQFSIGTHNDIQDVFVIHGTGAKRWKIWYPPKGLEWPKGGQGVGELSILSTYDDLNIPILSRKCAKMYSQLFSKPMKKILESSV